MTSYNSSQPVLPLSFIVQSVTVRSVPRASVKVVVRVTQTLNRLTHNIAQDVDLLGKAVI